MDKDLQKLKDIFLSSDIDSEDYQENLQYINDIEAEIRNNQDFSSWQKSDVTLSILKLIKDSYVELCTTLYSEDELSEKNRQIILAKKKACAWLISLISRDVESEMKSIHGKINATLNKIEG